MGSYVVVCFCVSGRFRRPDEALLCIRIRDGWLLLAVSGVNDCFLGRFWVFGLLACSLRRADVVSLAMGWWAPLVYEMRLRFY